jgi:hypothetical protein
MEVTGRRGRRRRKLLDDLKERRGCSNLKEEALDRTIWTARFGRGFGPVVRQTTKRMNVVKMYSYSPPLCPFSSQLNHFLLPRPIHLTYITVLFYHFRLFHSKIVFEGQAGYAWLSNYTLQLIRH